MENTNTKKAANQAEKAAEQAKTNTNTTEPKKAAEQAEKTTNRKEEKTIKNNEQKKAAAPKKAAPKKNTKNAATEQKKIEVLQPDAIRKLIETAKTAYSVDERKAAAEKAAKAIEAFNASSLENAVNRADFMNAAEAVRPSAPKNLENRRKGYDYERRADVVEYVIVDEEGNDRKRALTLPVYAAAAFRTKATAEQKAAFDEALTALETLQKSMIESNNVSGAKAAAAALTKLSTACGLNEFTKKGEYDFYIDRSYVYAAFGRMNAKRGEFKTTAASVTEAAAKAFEAKADKRAAALERAAKAYDNAAKLLFNVINAAAAAAVVGTWKATVVTAEDVTAAAAARAAKVEERAAKAAEAAAKKAAKAATEQNAAEAAENGAA